MSDGHANTRNNQGNSRNEILPYCGVVSVTKSNSMLIQISSANSYSSKNCNAQFVAFIKVCITRWFDLIFGDLKKNCDGEIGIFGGISPEPLVRCYPNLELKLTR